MKQRQHGSLVEGIASHKREQVVCVVRDHKDNLLLALSAQDNPDLCQFRYERIFLFLATPFLIEFISVPTEG